MTVRGTGSGASPADTSRISVRRQTPATVDGNRFGGAALRPHATSPAVSHNQFRRLISSIVACGSGDDWPHRGKGRNGRNGARLY